MRTAVLFSTLLFADALFCANTQVNFDPSSPDVGPFPTDFLTAPDSAQKTGRRINLPFRPACGSQDLSACTDTALLNQLDGFSLNPRIRVCFSDPIDASTVPDGVFLFALNRPAQRIRVNKVFYDPATRCAFGKPESVLEAGRRYALAVTGAVRDSEGKFLKASKEYKDCLKKEAGPYCSDVADVLLQWMESWDRLTANS